MQTCKLQLEESCPPRIPASEDLATCPLQLPDRPQFARSSPALPSSTPGQAVNQGNPAAAGNAIAQGAAAGGNDAKAQAQVRPHFEHCRFQGDS
jgi:hypothetical protein